MTHVWLYNPATDASWRAPEGLVDALLAAGWEDRGTPVEENPATAEHAAWREARAAEAAEKAAAEKPAAKKTTTVKAAASAESQEG
ncbi:MAG TPA: hypothetical protein VIQ30_08560 [Pseudonocardia sp.]